MNKAQKRKRMTIDLPFDEHRKLKAMNHLLNENEPNEETLAAFR